MSSAASQASASHDSDRYKELFEMLFEAIPSSVLVIDAGLRITATNKNFLEKSRKKRSEVIGRRLEDILPQAFLEHMDIVGRVQEVFYSNRAIRGERMTYRAPGIPLRTYYYSICPFSWQGHVENTILLMEDVTEQVRLSEEVRRVERHLAGVVESARDIVLSTDSQGEILTWNSAAERLSGYHLEEVKGTSFVDRCAPDPELDLKRFLSSLQRHGKSETLERDLLTKKGKHVPISWVFSPMKDEATQSMGFVAVGRDLSEHRKLEFQLLQSQKLAALGVMAGGIAHEIKNPLAISSSAAQLLADDVSPEFRTECVERILSGIQKAATIVENVLRFARPSSTTEMTQLDLLPVVKDTVGLVANQARIQKIGIVEDFKVQHVRIRGNSSLLQQVFLNLFLNAIHAMPDGGTLSVAVEANGAEALVRISDTGHGIPKDCIGKIFDPFFTLSPPGKGTGLGLSICYSVVGQHLGRIEVESSVGHGATFSVRLPLF